MKKVILLAGPPATGKTYMSNIIISNHPHAMYIAQDEVIELLYNKIGFSTTQAKIELIDFGRSIFYEIVTKSLEENELVILDYPFSFKQLQFLDNLKQNFNVQFMTLCLEGNFDVLYDRRLKRDLMASRNKGHVLEVYHGYETYDIDNYPLSRDQYKQNCIQEKY